MKIVEAKIFVELHCICPYCGSVIDYYDYIANHLCINVFDNVGSIFDVVCPECKSEFGTEIEN
jgi:DNA-directed RNA polymerase subunit RPC12/RpoP